MDRTRNKFLTRSGLSGDQHGGVRGSNLRHKREYFLQGARSPDDPVAHRSVIDFFGEGDALVFESLFRLIWIRHDYRDASHNLCHRSTPVRPHLFMCALWSRSRLGTTPDGVTVDTISDREEYPLKCVRTNTKEVSDLTLSVWR